MASENSGTLSPGKLISLRAEIDESNLLGLDHPDWVYIADRLNLPWPIVERYGEDIVKLSKPTSTIPSEPKEDRDIVRGVDKDTKRIHEQPNKQY